MSAQKLDTEDLQTEEAKTKKRKLLWKQQVQQIKKKKDPIFTAYFIYMCFVIFVTGFVFYFLYCVFDSLTSVLDF